MADDEFKFPDEREGKLVQPDANEVELEIVDDTPEKDRGRKPLSRAVEDPTDEELSAYSEGVRKRIADLTHARHDERRNREAVAREKMELERLAQGLLEENRQLKHAVNNGSLHFAETARFGAETALEVAKRQYKEAYELGDADAILAAHQELTEAQLQAAAAKNFRPEPLQVDDFPVQLGSSPEPEPQLDRKTARWVERNDWWGKPGNEDITSFALGLHQKLVNSGVDPRSDEYFERIDARLHAKFPEVFAEGDDEPATGSRRSTSVVAPSTRSTSAKRIKLTASALAVAKRLNLTPQQYAAEVAKLERNNG